MEFGIFDHLDRGGAVLKDCYDMRLKLIESYDRAGFYGYHVAEHHSTPLGLAPSPSLFLSAAAQRTKQLKLATLVYAMPLHHPLRLIEEICMLDQMSGGRFEMGFGRGSSPIELEYFGVDPADSARDYAEGLEVILQGLRERTVNAQTRARDIHDVPMELAPIQQPHPPIWYGVHSLESAQKAALGGFNIACNEPAATSATYIDQFKQTWAHTHGDNASLPKIGATHFVVVADTDKEALEIARRSYLVWHKSFHFLFKRHGRAARLSGGEADFDALCARGKGAAGTPEKVIAFLKKRMIESGANYCINRFAFGDITLDEAQHSIDLYTRHVMPELRSM
jgi:alkanesulfonate monooxygenase SsuD/methylene tetrahydromethanopterin reductase-like flavin-dependent oxidoreductase (luciferase family)